MELFEVPEKPVFSGDLFEVKEKSILDDFISSRPIWLFCTFNARTFSMWKKEILFPTTEFARIVKTQMLSSRVLTRNTCIVQVQLETQQEAEIFFMAAQKCGIFPKSKYNGLVSDRTF